MVDKPTKRTRISDAKKCCGAPADSARRAYGAKRLLDGAETSLLSALVLHELLSKVIAGRT